MARSEEIGLRTQTDFDHVRLMAFLYDVYALISGKTTTLLSFGQMVILVCQR